MFEQEPRFPLKNIKWEQSARTVCCNMPISYSDIGHDNDLVIHCSGCLRQYPEMRIETPPEIQEKPRADTGV